MMEREATAPPPEAEEREGEAQSWDAAIGAAGAAASGGNPGIGALFGTAMGIERREEARKRAEEQPDDPA